MLVLAFAGKNFIADDDDAEFGGGSVVLHMHNANGTAHSP
jgi:hypothetical protein